MPRLPQPGADAGQWGSILNEYLSVSLDEDGTLKTNSIGAAQLKPGAVTNAAIATGTIAEDKLSSAVQTKLNTGATAPVTSVAGKTGDVSLVKADVGLSNVDNTSDASKPISNATQTALNAKADTATLTSGLNGKVNTSSVGAASGVAGLDNNAKLSENQLPIRLGENELNATYIPLATAAKNPELLIVGNINRDTNQAITSADVVWPDGKPGTFTALVLSNSFPGAIDSYKVTYGSPTAKTFTQPAITRNANGAVTNIPQMVVS
ncbi:MAG: hypothetical protein WAR37_00285 [Candidatus Microsaccharimonas sp.]